MGTIVGGGDDELKTEKCSYKNNQMNCTSQPPSFPYYLDTPESMVISDDYC